MRPPSVLYVLCCVVDEEVHDGFGYQILNALADDRKYEAINEPDREVSISSRIVNWEPPSEGISKNRSVSLATTP